MNANALLRAERFFDRFSAWIGRLSALLLLLLLVNVFYDVLMRYLFRDVSIGMQELEWHLYSAVFLLGVAYALSVDGHVRVDLLYERWDPRRRALIDIVGTVLLLWPFCLLVAVYGIGFAHEAFTIGEISGDPGGLPFRWVVKALIPTAFICVLISSVGFMLRALNQLLGYQTAQLPPTARP
ncbi:MAG: TRAP transporter small permease subunit [Chromatiaceae bacterium]|nr:TRAP transporter small permease subunit [Gammaproteobacteria bacterium]MCP5306401.1 TRAP transporter small permease subunit [Chromatiaceae bacterium]MCP5311953.1 TRAP transporter small permease subunit [Chromatiaceae bacterium]